MHHDAKVPFVIAWDFIPLHSATENLIPTLSTIIRGQVPDASHSVSGTPNMLGRVLLRRFR
jgi:hypothetical protein